MINSTDRVAGAEYVHARYVRDHFHDLPITWLKLKYCSVESSERI